MNEKMIKTETKVFLLPDYEEEEQYLSEMHRNGWRLNKVNLYRYSFEKCEPENVIYRLDFCDNSKDRDSYIKMHEDYGWEYIQDLNNFSYFRKKAEGLSDEELEIFSDNESRPDMMQKVIKTKLTPLWILFIALIIPNLCNALLGSYGNSVTNIIIFAVWAVLFVIYTYIFIRCYKGFRKLKEKYSKE